MISFSIQDRSYGGKIFRPRPELYVSDNSDLLIVATPWGPRSSAKKVIDRMLDYIALSRDDRETTSPFERLSCLSSMANNLRIATLLANELIYRDDNRDDFQAGVEVFALASSGREIVWLQVGSPQVLLSRGGRALMPLGSQLDLSTDMSSNNTLPPLPSQLLGLDTSANLTINSFRARSQDQLILLSHSRPTSRIYGIPGSDINLDNVSRLLARDDSDAPFWIAQIRLKTEQPSDDE